MEGSLLGRRAEREGVGAVLVIDPAAAKAEDGPAHRLDRDGAREDEQVAPGQRGAVLELERGEQVPRLIQIGVVLPRALRVEALPAALGAAAPIGDAVAATIVPSEAHKKGSVGAVVRRPDGLRAREEVEQVALDGVPVHTRRVRRRTRAQRWVVERERRAVEGGGEGGGTKRGGDGREEREHEWGGRRSVFRAPSSRLGRFLGKGAELLASTHTAL